MRTRDRVADQAAALSAHHQNVPLEKRAPQQALKQALKQCQQYKQQNYMGQPTKAEAGSAQSSDGSAQVSPLQLPAEFHRVLNALRYVFTPVPQASELSMLSITMLKQPL